MPIKTKQPHDVLIGLKEVLDKIGIPEILYSDSEGSFNSTEFVRFINSKQLSTYSRTAMHILSKPSIKQSSNKYIHV